MTEAEARAFVTERLAALHRDCREVGTHPMSCYCGGTGHIARDWHVWEDLIPAMEAAGWTWGANRGLGWLFWRPLDPYGTRNLPQVPSPIIAAALALQQEESDA